MAGLEYLDKLDSARTGREAWGNVDQARDQAIDFLVWRLLRGATPVLPQNQAFDGAAILQALDPSGAGFIDEDLLRLFADGQIRVALHNPRPNGTLLDAYQAALERDGFIFSGWPELAGGPVTRARLLDAVVSGHDDLLPRPTAARLRALRQLSQAAATQRMVTRPPRDGEGRPTLAEWIRRSLVGYDRPAVVECLSGLIGDPALGRSACYTRLAAWRDANRITAEDAVAARAIVDRAYDHVIVASLEVDEAATTTGARNLLGHLEAVREHRRSTAGIARVEPESSLRPDPLDWRRLRNVLADMATAAPHERRKAASRYLMEQELDDDSTLVRFQWGQRTVEMVVRLVPDPRVAVGTQVAVTAAGAIFDVLRKHRLHRLYMGFFEEDDPHE